MLRIAGRHGLHQPHSVARFHILFPWSHMHPAHQITAAFNNHTIAEIADPRRYRHADCRPFITCSLRISLYQDYAIVQFYFTIGKFRFTEPGARFNHINSCSIHFENCGNSIEITVSPAPEMKSVNLRACPNCSGFSRRDFKLIAPNRFDGFVIHIINIYDILKFPGCPVFIFNLCLSDNFGRSVFNVNILSVDVLPRGAKSAE